MPVHLPRQRRPWFAGVIAWLLLLVLLFGSTACLAQTNNTTAAATTTSTRYVNFTQVLDPTTTTLPEKDSSLPFDLFGQLQSYLNAISKETNRPELNNLLDNFLTNATAEFTIANGFLLDLGGGTVVNLTHVSVGGLNTFEAVNLFQPSTNSSTVLQNAFVLERLFLDLVFTETTPALDVVESTVRLPFQGANFTEVPLQLALLAKALESLPMGALLTMEDYLMPCLQGIIQTLQLLNMKVNFAQVLPPQLLKVSEKNHPAPFFNLVTTLFVSFPASVPIFFDTTVVGILNDQFEKMLSSTNGPGRCPSDGSATTKTLVDFRSFFQASLPKMIKEQLIDEQLLATDPITGLPKINQVLVEPWIESSLSNNNNDNATTAEAAAGDPSLWILGDPSKNYQLVDVSSDISIGGLEANLQLVISDLTIRNLNTMRLPMELLESLEEHPHQLSNRLTVGLDLQDRPLEIAANLYFVLANTQDGSTIDHDLHLQLNLQGLSVTLVALLKVLQEKLEAFPLQNIGQIPCWLAIIDRPLLEERTNLRKDDQEIGLGIAQLAMSLEDMVLEVSCEDDGSCSTLGMQEWTTQVLPTLESQKGVKKAFDQLLDWASRIVSGPVLQAPIDVMLQSAPTHCPHNPNYDPQAVMEWFPQQAFVVPPVEAYEYSYDYLIAWGSVLVALLALLGILAMGISWKVRSKRKRWLESSQVHQEWLRKEESAQEQLEDHLNRETKALVSSSQIPIWIRWGMPLIILGNIGLFLSGHLNLGATVTIQAQLAGESFEVDDFFTFSIARSTVDIWKAGGTELAILILIFSGIWPYTKQLLTLWLWFVPPHSLSVSKRGSALVWIDKLAKWSMIDIFVILICIVAFRLQISSPDVAFLTDDFYSIDLLVVPLWGLYANMIAQLVSQVSSHWILHYHRRVVETTLESFESPRAYQNGLWFCPTTTTTERTTTTVVLKAVSYANPYGNTPEARWFVKGWVSHLLKGIFAMTVGLVIAGCTFPSFGLELLGMIGLFVEFGQSFEAVRTDHSVFSILSLLFEEARFLDTPRAYIGITSLCALFLTTILIVPIAQAVALIRQWFVGMNFRTRNRVAVRNEILQAWQYMEVYILALFVASWQLGPVSEYMFNVYCGALDPFFAQMVYYGVIENDDAQCFSVQGSIEGGSFALVAAAFLLALLNSVVTKAATQWELENNSHATTDASKPPSDENPSRPIVRDVLFTDAYFWLVQESSP